MGTVISSSENYDYSVLALRCTRPNFDRSWQMFTDVALHPSFAKEDVALVQERLVVSLRDDTDDPDTYLQRLQERVAYANHPYLNRVEGTAESVSRLTVEDLRRYHQKVLETSRLLLVIVGDLDSAKVRSAGRPRVLANCRAGLISRNLFRNWRLINRRSKSPPAICRQTTFRDSLRRRRQTRRIFIRCASPARFCATGFFRKCARKEISRMRRTLSCRNQGANIGGIYVTAVDANQSVQLMLDEIARLQKEPIEDEDIQAVVAQYLTTYYMGQETNAAQAASWPQYELLGGGWRNSIVFVEKLSAVTPADVAARGAEVYAQHSLCGAW